MFLLRGRGILATFLLGNSARALRHRRIPPTAKMRCISSGSRRRGDDGAAIGKGRDLWTDRRARTVYVRYYGIVRTDLDMYFFSAHSPMWINLLIAVAMLCSRQSRW